MMHRKRTWHRRPWTQPVETAEELAEKLTQYAWTGCTAFEYQHPADGQRYLFVNDSTGPDGAQEYAVIRLHGWEHPAPPESGSRARVALGEQVESWTVSWMTPEELLEHLALLPQETGGEVRANFIEQEEPCYACA